MNVSPPSADEIDAFTYQSAVALVRSGEPDRAHAVCEQILRTQPTHSEALLLRGVIELQMAQPGRACGSFSSSIRARPDHAIAHALLGDALLEADRAIEAVASYEHALQLSPGLVPARFGRANAMLDLGDPLQALADYDELLLTDSANVEVLFNRGNALLALERFTQSVDSYDRAISLNPEYAAAYNNRGSALMSLHRLEDATRSFEAALRLDGGLMPGFKNLAGALQRTGRADEALQTCDRALALGDQSAEIFCCRGDALLDLRRADEALAAYQQAASVAPASAQAETGIGNALAALHRYDEALTRYQESHRIDPGSAAVDYNIGRVHLECGRPLEALQSFERALELQADFPQALRSRADVLLALQQPAAAAQSLNDLLKLGPDADYAAGALLHARGCSADWSVSNAAASRDAVRRAVLAGKRADSPFSFLSVADDPAAQLACARTYMENHCPPIPPLGTGSRGDHARLRVAYLSADFRAHAVSYLLAGVLEQHDPRRFETFGISLRSEEDSDVGRRIKGAFTRFIDVSGQSDRAVAELMIKLQIDIAVDLVGCTDGLRPRILAHRPAPLQVQYLGYPGTMGAAHVDYVIADEFVVPPDHRAFFSENVVYLPGCFQANDDSRRISNQTVSRADAGLPATGFVFCCFNNTYKINAAMFDIWIPLLLSVPGSVLWLLGADDAAAANFRREAAARGVDEARIVFATREPYDVHLQRLRLGDLFLDTLPFNGGTTISDALWAGLPVLTCAGRSFAARMGGSLLRAAGLPELITHDADEYARQAFELARQPAILAALRQRLKDTRETMPLFDTDRFRRNLEAAYEQMWVRHRRGESPAAFTVPS